MSANLTNSHRSESNQLFWWQLSCYDLADIAMTGVLTSKLREWNTVYRQSTDVIGASWDNSIAVKMRAFNFMYAGG